MNEESKAPSLFSECVAEIVGTFILVFFGIGAVHAAVLTGAQSGIWQIGVVWAVAIALAIYAVGSISGAHINPAVTLAFAAFRSFPGKKVPAFILSQFIGAFIAAALLYAIFANVLISFETQQELTRGGEGSELSAMVYGMYFPNPAVAKALEWPDQSVTHFQAMLAETVGTLCLVFFVFALTEAKNPGGPGAYLAPIFIGLTVGIIISVIAPLTQAGLNPARDLGPRLLAFLAGWGTVAIPGPRGGFFTVYTLAPLVGGLAGAGLYQAIMKPRYPKEENE